MPYAAIKQQGRQRSIVGAFFVRGVTSEAQGLLCRVDVAPCRAHVVALPAPMPQSHPRDDKDSLP